MMAAMPGLVVGAQKRRAVREDHVFALVLSDFRKLIGAKDDPPPGVEHHVAALVAQDPGLCVCARRIGRRVHVGDESDGGIVFAARRRLNARVDHAALATQAFSTPSALSSSTRKAASSSSLAAEGAVALSRTDCVSNATYCKKRSAALMLSTVLIG